ncbi:MAG TPA: hypothetical protein VHR45_20200 [Thermoanaerobaculia bacterium]|nr:hypothetical protein [Thermoanaerobaculia bacterium]
MDDPKPTPRRGSATPRLGILGGGAMAAAAGYALATLCCLPFAAGALGVALAANGAFLAPYRLYLGGLALLLLAPAFFRSYRGRSSSAGDGAPDARRWRLWLVSLGVAALLLAPLWTPLVTSAVGGRAPSRGGPLQNLGSIEELKSAFNREAGRPRLILLLSPT